MSLPADMDALPVKWWRLHLTAALQHGQEAIVQLSLLTLQLHIQLFYPGSSTPRLL
jgi:hypothetical protein